MYTLTGRKNIIYNLLIILSWTMVYLLNLYNLIFCSPTSTRKNHLIIWREYALCLWYVYGIIT